MKTKILIVDNDDEIRSFIRKVLISNNFSVEEASDGKQALEAVEKYNPNLVILDYNLPKVAGETVCVKIKQFHPEIIVIILTDKCESADVVRGLQIGADDFISKPFAEDELVARIYARLRKHAASRNLQPIAVNGAPVVIDQNKQKIETTTKDRPISRLVLRESVFLIVARLISTEIVFGMLYLFLSLFGSFISSFIDTTSFSSIYYVVVFMIFILNLWAVMMIAVKWSSEYAEISQDGVVKHTGIFHKKEQKYACSFIEGVKIEQSFLGSIFDFGTIELYDPALKEQVFLYNINSPKKNSEIIQKIISKKGQSIPFIA